MGTSAIGLLAILYVVIAGNYVGDLFSCELQRKLTHNFVYKHAIVLLGALFWVAEVTDATDEDFVTVLLRACAIYILFLFSTKTEWWALAPVLALLVADQIMRIFESKSSITSRGKDAITPPPDVSGKRVIVQRIRTCIQGACVLTILVGFAAYALRQKREKGAAFKVGTLMMGSTRCRGI